MHDKATEDIAKTLRDFPAIDPRTAIIAVDPGLYCVIPDETRASAAREIERLRARTAMLDKIVERFALALMEIRTMQGNPIEIARKAMDTCSDEQTAPRCDMCGEPKDGRDHSGCDRAYPETLQR